MAKTYKVLGQVNPAATALTTLYTVPAANSTVCSTLVICNQGTSTTYRVAIQPANAAISTQHYSIYDSPINGNDSVFLTMGFTLAATDVVSVYAATANVVFQLYGAESY